MPKKTRRPARTRPARAKPSTALVKRIPSPVVARTDVIDAVLDRRVGEDLALGELGLVEIKLTAKEERILDEPIPLDEVRVKPTGQPYLSHPSYTRWFNRAFGRGGWNLVPVSKALRSGNSVVCPYVLFIHGKPAAFAIGEQEYFESNREQTYGDALESTVASALRRCAKRLGVSLDLWDRAWTDDYMNRNAVRVRVKNRDGSASWVWRRRQDGPLPYEISGREAEDYPEQDTRPAQRAEAPRRPQGAPRRQGSDRPLEVITEPQQRRLWVIIQNSGRDYKEVAAWLARRFGLEGKEPERQVLRRDYDFIWKAIEAPGALPEGKRAD